MQDLQSGRRILKKQKNFQQMIRKHLRRSTKRNPEIIVTEEKADLQTAEPGLSGDSGSGEPDELVGKIPKRRNEEAEKEQNNGLQRSDRGRHQNVFMNPEEFADLHVLNGVEVPVQIDNNEQIERERDSIRTWMVSM